MVTTEFSSAELRTAKYLHVGATSHRGYPQPEDDFAYKRITYDALDYCKHCGVGGRQVAPFRLRQAPQWGSKLIFQLNWVFDEFFVRPDVWSAIFEPLGIPCRSVVQNKTGAVLDSVVQLDITELVDLELDGCEYEICSHCSRKKYLPFVRGYYPKPLQEIKGAAFKSNQWFGSGASAHKAVRISNELCRKITTSKLKGLYFDACRP